VCGVRSQFGLLFPMKQEFYRSNMQRTFPLLRVHILFITIWITLHALCSQAWKSNSILPTQMGYAEWASEWSERERIFARITAELLYANAGAERLSNNFTAARCTWSCDKVTENIAAERGLFFYCPLHMFGSERYSGSIFFLFAVKYFLLLRFATAGAENKIAWVQISCAEILFWALRDYGWMGKT